MPTIGMIDEPQDNLCRVRPHCIAFSGASLAVQGFTLEYRCNHLSCAVFVLAEAQFQLAIFAVVAGL